MSDTPTIEHEKSGAVRILLVEDDDGCAVFLQAVLSGWRYGAFRVQRAVNLSAALQEVARGGMDLVLLDLGLPDSCGFDTFVRMNAAASARVPIIVLSGLEDEMLATATVQQGAQDYIVKGQIDGASLARTIRYAIERFRAQQALTAEHDLLRSLIDNIPDQVYLKDIRSRFVTVNSVTASFFGASAPDQIVGKCDFDFFPRELAEQFLAEEQALLRYDQPSVTRETAVPDSAGNVRWVVTTKVPLRDSAGKITGILGINHDITARKETEDAICRLNEELEQRVTERTADLRAINEQLRKAMAQLEEHDRMMAEFVSSVSHELKTPLASMKWGIGNLLGGVIGPMPDKVREYLEMIDTNGQRMAGTIEDILDLSRLESKTMRLHRARLPLERLIRRAVTALRTQAQTKSIEIVLSIGQGCGFVECDALKLVRSIINVIGNAIKFTPDRGRVEIGLRGENAVQDVLIVEVTDTGIGIAPQHLERVTDKYFRVGEHVSGVGLGLSIAKEIVELHGGRLTVQSPPPGRDCGTRVSIIMPVVVPPTILIANEDEKIRTLLDQQLSSFKYHVIACAAGEDVLDLARRSRPDLAILDIVPARVGETDLVLCMKADLDLQKIPIVVIEDGVVNQGKNAVLNGLGIQIMRRQWCEEDLLDRIEAAMRGVSFSHVAST
ncbi:MAG: ATP-binding protein [bacterium]